MMQTLIYFLQLFLNKTLGLFISSVIIMVTLSYFTTYGHAARNYSITRTVAKDYTTLS